MIRDDTHPEPLFHSPPVVASEPEALETVEAPAPESPDRNLPDDPTDASGDPGADLDHCPVESSVRAIAAIADRLRLVHEEGRLTAPELATKLERHPETRARMLIDNQPRFRTWALVEELLERCLRAIFDADAYRAVRIARLAVAVADRLDASETGPALAADLLARAWGSLGNAYRCAGQLKAAASALERAEEILLDGTGDPLEEATLLGFRASLASSLGEYGQAADVLERVCDIYEEVGETYRRARTLVKMCTPYGLTAPEEAIKKAEEAEKLLDPERDGLLFLIARHNRVLALVDSGKPEQASMLLEASRRHYRRSGNRWMQLNLAWAEGRLAAALGNLDEAEASFEILLPEMLQHGYRLEGALVALDMAACRIALGKTREASELASAMAHNLREWGAHAQARNACALLGHACEVERASTELVREVALYLRRSWQNPHLPLSGRLARELGPELGPELGQTRRD